MYRPKHSFLVTDGSHDRFLKFYFLMSDKKVHEFFKILKLWGYFFRYQVMGQMSIENRE